MVRLQSRFHARRYRTRIAVIAVNTFLAGIAGGLIAYYIQLSRTGKGRYSCHLFGSHRRTCGNDGPVRLCRQLGCPPHWVHLRWIGIWSAGVFEETLKVDDPVWAIACHGVCGVWGLLALGIFASGDFLEVSGLIAGGIDTFVAQVISIVTVVAWTGIASAVIFGVLKATIGLRVPEADEDAGVDATKFTQPGYVLDEAIIASSRFIPTNATETQRGENGSGTCGRGLCGSLSRFVVLPNKLINRAREEKE